MGKTVFIFPGQGSQFPGMGRELYNSFPQVRGLYDNASALSGLDLKKLSFEGPLEELNNDLPAQLCVYVCNEAWRLWVAGGGLRAGSGHRIQSGFLFRARRLRRRIFRGRLKACNGRRHARPETKQKKSRHDGCRNRPVRGGGGGCLQRSRRGVRRRLDIQCQRGETDTGFRACGCGK